MSKKETSDEGSDEKGFFSLMSSEGTSEERTEETPEDEQETSEDEVVFDFGKDEESEPEEDDSEEEEELVLNSEEGSQEEDDERSPVPYKRFQQQGKKLRDRIADLEKRLKEKPKRSETEEKFLSLYGNFKDPVTAAEFDKEFMNSMEALQNDPEVAAAVKKVQAHQKGQTVTESNETQRPKPEEPKSDGKVEKLVMRQIRREVADFVSGPAQIQEKFRRPIVKEMMERLSPDDLDALDTNRMRDVAREAIEELGWTPKFVQGRESGSKETKRPPSTPKRQAAQTSGKQSEEDDKKSDDKPKTVGDWQAESQKATRHYFNQRASQS